MINILIEGDFDSKIILCLVWILKIELLVSLVLLFSVCSSYGLNMQSYVPCITLLCLSKLWLKYILYLEFCRPLYYILLSVHVMASICIVLSHVLHFYVCPSWLNYLEFCPLYYILLSVQVMASICSVLSHVLHFIRLGNK